MLLHRRDGEYWSLPGGALEPGEFLEPARRELFEKTGLTVEELELLTVCSGLDRLGFEHTYPNGDRIHNATALYLATGVRGEPRTDGEEERDVCYPSSVDGLSAMPSAAKHMPTETLQNYPRI